MFQGKEQKGKVSKMEKKINAISAIIAIVVLLVTVAPLQAQALTNKQIAKSSVKMVEPIGFEPTTSSLRTTRSSS